MKTLIFPIENYVFDIKNQNYSLEAKQNLIGLLELVWTGIQKSPCNSLTIKEHKALKKVKNKLRDITTFKDKDEDSRINISRIENLVLKLEDFEYEVFKKVLEANIFTSAISERVSDLWDIIDGATTE